MEMPSELVQNLSPDEMYKASLNKNLLDVTVGKKNAQKALFLIFCL